MQPPRHNVVSALCCSRSMSSRYHYTALFKLSMLGMGTGVFYQTSNQYQLREDSKRCCFSANVTKQNNNLPPGWVLLMTYLSVIL